MSEPLWSLMYRYWFWGWLFRDVNQGDLLRRAAAWRHNVAMRPCLPVYMARWLACTAVAAGSAQASELATSSPVLPAMCYGAAVLAILVFTVALIIWTFLGRPSSA